MADYDVTLLDMENTFSSWLDGTLSPQEEAAFMDFCASNLEMQEIMESNDQLDEMYEALVEDGYELPAEMMDDFIIPQVEDNDDDVYSYEELSDVEDADNDNGTNINMVRTRGVVASAHDGIVTLSLWT